MNEKEKTNRLRELEAWLRTHYRSEDWPREQCRKAMEEYCLYKWAMSDGSAKNLTHIVQLRVTRTLPTRIEEPSVMRSVEEDEGKSLEEIIMTSVQDNPETYNPPKADFKVIEE
jgi:hypothetical protein